MGDAHLATFGGLLYDFQASGDFVLAQTGPDFVVQSRQVSGAPTWPDASVNHAVATRMGKTSVAVCLADKRPQLYVDGMLTDLAGGNSISRPDVFISRKNNTYFIRDETGNWVRAQVNLETPGWIDVKVGLGKWPVSVRGLLANAGRVSQIAARDGKVLTNPFSFEEVYHHYADSWRVKADESQLSVCGGAQSGIPKKPFRPRDVGPEAYQRAKAVCVAAGVKQGAYMDACLVDVAFTGNEIAAKVFVNVPAPAVVGRFR